ncbi:hypothetical protein Q9233_005816 [Columba guinea]|nr:hypothetical protein Q9233_005816 [Columba guinea]
MRDLTAQVTSSLLQFPEVTIQALGEDEITLDSVLFGKFSGGRNGLAWLACGPQLEVVNSLTGERLSAYRFSGVHEQPPIVRVVKEFSWQKRTGLLVGLEEGEGSVLCLYDLGISRVVKAVVLPERVTAIEPITNHGGASVSTQHLHQGLRWLFGVAAVATDVGHLLLVDLCLDDLSCSQNETEASGKLVVFHLEFKNLEVFTRIPAAVPRRRDTVTREGRHLSFQLQNPSGTAIPTLCYISRSNQLAVGFSDGYLSLWNMKTLKREYHSQLEGGRIPVYAVTFQEPENDPYNCCYLWAVQSTQESEGDVVSLHLLQLAFGDRKRLASGQVLYEGLEYCDERYSLDVTGGIFPLRGQTTNTRLLSCQTVEKFRNHVDREDSINEAISPDTSVSIFSWQVNTYGEGKPSTYLGVFDINRWYHAQMPDSLRVFFSLRPEEFLADCPYFALWSLDAIVSMTSPNLILDILAHERSLSRGVPPSYPPPEQFFNPSTYNFDGTCLLNSGVVHMTCTGVQKEEEQLEAILSAAVQTGSLELLTGCIKHWTSEEQPSSAANLQFLLEWTWNKVMYAKAELDQICFADLTNKHMVTSLISLYAQVVTWFCRSSLLPEGLDDNMHLSRPFYNYPLIHNYYTAHRQKLECLSRKPATLRGWELVFHSVQILGTFCCRGKWDSDCLMIDGLVSQLGDQIEKLWQRDEGGTGKYPPASLHSALALLFHPATIKSVSWQHMRVLQSLMCQGEHRRALRYIQMMKPPVSSSSEVRLFLTVLLSNRCLVEAWDLLQQHTTKLNIEELLKHMYEICQEMGLMEDLLKLPFTETEQIFAMCYFSQECLEKFLQTNAGVQSREFLLVHHLQRANYIPALQLHQSMKVNPTNDCDPSLRDTEAFRNAVLDQYDKILPRVQRKLATERAELYHLPSSVLREVSRPKPLSTVTKQANAENVCIFISNVLSKIGEVWVGNEQKPSFSQYDRLLHSVVHPVPSCSAAQGGCWQSPCEASASFMASSPLKSDLHSSISQRNFSGSTQLNLLETPPVVKRAKVLATSASTSAFPGFTPQSILRSSLRTTPLATPSASPGRSVTPPLRAKESRISFREENSKARGTAGVSWAVVEQPSSAANLRFVLQWTWNKVIYTKAEFDQICFADLTNKHMVISLISLYAQVVAWFCRSSLLPEGLDEDMRLSRPFYNYLLIQSYYTGHRQKLERLSRGKWDSDCLMIDGLVSQLGDQIEKLWQRDEGGTGKYPPASLHALLDVYLLEGIEESYKHAISALALLFHPATIKSVSWQHMRVLQSLMCQGEHRRALRYIQMMKPPVSSSSEVRLFLTVLLSNRCLVEAWDLLQQHTTKLNIEELLKHMYEICQEMGLMEDLLKLPFTETEQECLEKFLQTNAGVQSREFLLVHHLQRANYIPALQLHQSMKKTKVLATSASAFPGFTPQSILRSSLCTTPLATPSAPPGRSVTPPLRGKEPRISFREENSEAKGTAGVSWAVVVGFYS